ncbi:MAG: hypothetical protein M3376_01475 [Actinomycetota bacterium]|nr:hypothetical protein [Actinomycetota bacterium]
MKEDEVTTITLEGDHAGVYEVEPLREGELLLRPVTAVTAADIFDRQGLRPATDAEFAERFGDLPTDDEG